MIRQPRCDEKDILGGSSSITAAASTAFIAVASRKVNVARQLAKISAFFQGDDH